MVYFQAYFLVIIGVIFALIENGSSPTQHCKTCNLEIPTSGWAGHQRTLQHREKCCVEQEEGVQVVQTAFKYRLATYRVEGTKDSTNVKKFLVNLKHKTVALVESNVSQHGSIKVGMELFGRFLLQAKEAIEVKSFNSKFRVVCRSTDLEELFDQYSVILDKKATEFAEKESGFALHCWKCTSNMDATCRDYFNVTRNVLNQRNSENYNYGSIQSSRTVPQQVDCEEKYTTTFGQLKNVCLKVVTTVPHGPNEVKRECRMVNIDHKLGACPEDIAYGSNIRNVQFCGTCESDNCNSAGRHSFIVLGLVPAVVMLLRK